MFDFWLIIIIMIVVALAFILLPLFIYPKHRAQSSRKQNIQLFKKRLEEIEAQYLAHEIEAAEYQASKAEMTRSLMDIVEGQEDEERQTVSASKFMAICMAILIPVVAVLMYMRVGDLRQLKQYWHQRSHSALVRDALQQFKSPSDVVNSLKSVLAKKPNASPHGWYLLGRLYLEQKKYPLAVAALLKSNQQKPNNPEVMTALAEASFFKNDRKLMPSAKVLLQKVLNIVPKQIAAINLLAIDAYNQGQYQDAVNYWEEILPAFPEDSADRKALMNMIAMAQKKIASKVTP